MVCEPTDMDTAQNPSSSNNQFSYINNNNLRSNNMQHNRWRIDQLFEGCRLKVDMSSGRTYSEQIYRIKILILLLI